jgi:hypothetical protein
VPTITKCDLDFVIAMHHKYDLTIASWYARMEPESQEQWIERRVNLSLERTFYQGLLLVKGASISYTVPVQSLQDTHPLVEVYTANVNTGKYLTMTVPYSDLYSTLESLIQKELNMI